MKDANKPATHISCLINRSVLGEDGKPYQRLLEKYVKDNGIEWTVTRLKACYNAALHLKNNDHEKAIAMYRKCSIAYTSKGYPKDRVLSLPMKRFVSSKSPIKIKRYAAVLRTYTLYKLDRVSVSQCKKVVTSIVSPSTMENKPNVLEHCGKLLNIGMASSGIPNDLKKVQFDKQDFSLDNLSPFTACYSTGSVPKALKQQPTVLRKSYEFPDGPMGKRKTVWTGKREVAISEKPWFKSVNSLMSTTYLPEVLQKVVPCIEVRQRQDALFHTRMDESLYKRTRAAGKVHIIQEGGAKARAVAIPNAWVQMGFYPLHKKLVDITEKYVSQYSCVTDQQRGALQVLKQLESGQPCFSVDLSAATDRFPIEFQTAVLRKVGLGPYAIALEELCAQDWEFPQAREFGTNTVKYNVGQPMGLYGSFPLFNLTHILLVKGLCEVLEATFMPDNRLLTFDDGTPFKILGDDIIIADKRLCDAYRNIMTLSGVEVSPLKTFEGEVAEFAGFIMMKANTASGVLGFRPYKFPKEPWLTNPINLLDALGKDITKIHPRWQAIFDLYQRSVHKRRLDLAPVFSTASTQVGTTGKLSIQTVVSIRDNLVIAKGDKGIYLTAESWNCKDPIVYDGFRRDSTPMVVDRSKPIELIGPPDPRNKWKPHKGLHRYPPARRVKYVSPLTEREEDHPRKTPHSVETSRKVNRDPVLVEEKAMDFAAKLDAAHLASIASAFVNADPSDGAIEQLSSEKCNNAKISNVLLEKRIRLKP